MLLTCFGSLCGGSLIIDLVRVAILFDTLNELLLQMSTPTAFGERGNGYKMNGLLSAQVVVSGKGSSAGA